MKKSKKETPKPTLKLKSENEPKDNVASYSKGKENLSDELIINNSEIEEINEHDLKRRKAHEAQIDEPNRIVK